jgi:hypothetical protein
LNIILKQEVSVFLGWMAARPNLAAPRRCDHRKRFATLIAHGLIAVVIITGARDVGAKRSTVFTIISFNLK